MLNKDKALTCKVKELTNNSHESIQGVWTGGKGDTEICISGKMHYRGVRDFSQDLSSIFREFDSYEAELGIVKDIEVISSEEDDYFAERVTS